MSFKLRKPKNFNFSIIFFQKKVIIIFFKLFYFVKICFKNRIIILAIFSPIFILYPVAEIEVLGRKELIIFFIIFYYYLLFDIKI